MEQLNSVLIQGVLVEDARKERGKPCRLTVRNIRGERELTIDLFYKGRFRATTIANLKAGTDIKVVGSLEYGKDGVYVLVKHIEYKVDRVTKYIDAKEDK